jgi:hypothetical protein
VNRRTRNNFSKTTQRAALARSKGICECHLIPHVFKDPCGLRLGDGNTFYEHIDPDAICGRNDLANCAAMTRNCWRYKTSFYDLPVIAKVKRVADLARGIKDPWRQRLPGGRDDYRKKKVNGQVVLR